MHLRCQKLYHNDERECKRVRCDPPLYFTITEPGMLHVGWFAPALMAHTSTCVAPDGIFAGTATVTHCTPGTPGNVPEETLVMAWPAITALTGPLPGEIRPVQRISIVLPFFAGFLGVFTVLF